MLARASNAGQASRLPLSGPSRQTEPASPLGRRDACPTFAKGAH